MAFPTIPATYSSPVDAVTDGSNNYDLTGVTVPGGTGTLLVRVSTPRGSGQSINTCTWDQGGVNETVTACGTYRNSGGWGGGRIFRLANPTAGASKTIRVNTNVPADQICVVAIPITEGTTEIGYNSANFTDGAGSYNDSISAIACAVGDAIFSLKSDDIGSGDGGSVSYTTGTQEIQRSTGSGDSFSTFGYLVASSTSETITYAQSGVVTGGNAVEVYVVLRSAAPAPTINTHPSTQYLERGRVATFFVSATTSGGALSYQWQSNQGGSFADLSNDGDHNGVTTDTLTVLARQSKQGVLYRCVVTDSNGSMTSNAAALQIFAQLPFRFVVPYTMRTTRAFDAFDLSAWNNLRVSRWMADELPHAAGAGSITGTASITLDALTAAGTGALLIRGTASVTLADATLAGTGVLTIKGTTSITLADVTLAGTGALAIKGTASVTLADATLAGTGALAIKATASVTLEDLTLAGVGTSGTGISGTASITLADLTAAGTGALAIQAAASIALDALTVAGTGQLAVAGTLNTTLADATLTSAGQLAIRATASVALADVTLSGTGTSPRNASAAITLDDLTSSGQGNLAIRATLATTLGDVTLFGIGIDPNAASGGDTLGARSPLIRVGRLLAT